MFGAHHKNFFGRRSIKESQCMLVIVVIIVAQMNVHVFDHWVAALEDLNRQTLAVRVVGRGRRGCHKLNLIECLQEYREGRKTVVVKVDLCGMSTPRVRRLRIVGMQILIGRKGTSHGIPEGYQKGRVRLQSVTGVRTYRMQMNFHVAGSRQWRVAAIVIFKTAGLFVGSLEPSTTESGKGGTDRVASGFANMNKGNFARSLGYLGGYCYGVVLNVVIMVRNGCYVGSRNSVVGAYYYPRLYLESRWCGYCD